MDTTCISQKRVGEDTVELIYESESGKRTKIVMPCDPPKLPTIRIKCDECSTMNTCDFKRKGEYYISKDIKCILCEHIIPTEVLISKEDLWKEARI